MGVDGWVGRWMDGWMATWRLVCAEFSFAVSCSCAHSKGGQAGTCPHAHLCTGSCTQLTMLLYSHCRLDKQERTHIGVGQLRRFLEQLLQRRYLENVPTIVPLLEKEYRHAQARLAGTQQDLQDLHPDRLKVGRGVVLGTGLWGR